MPLGFSQVRENQSLVSEHNSKGTSVSFILHPYYSQEKITEETKDTSTKVEEEDSGKLQINNVKLQTE